MSVFVCGHLTHSHLVVVEEMTVIYSKGAIQNYQSKKCRAVGNHYLFSLFLNCVMCHIVDQNAVRDRSFAVASLRV